MRLGALDLGLVRLQIKGKICLVLFTHFRVVSQNRPPWIVRRFVPVSTFFAKRACPVCFVKIYFEASALRKPHSQPSGSKRHNHIISDASLYVKFYVVYRIMNDEEQHVFARCNAGCFNVVRQYCSVT
jgi:hypothetical protein